MVKTTPNYMKLHFIPVRYKLPVEIPIDLISKLPEKIVLFTTAQYMDQLPKFKENLEKAGKKVELFKPKHSVTPGHLLGCGVEHWETDAEAFLFVGDGLFHPKALVIHNEQPVWCYDPKREEFFVMENEEIERAKKKQLGALKTFYAKQKIGVLITTKYGQQRLVMSLKLREKFPEKEFYFFLFDSLDWNGLEDFPFVECFINTMCPRIGLDDTNKLEKPVVDIGELGFAW